jgi:hypothetical protein
MRACTTSNSGLRQRLCLRPASATHQQTETVLTQASQPLQPVSVQSVAALLSRVEPVGLPVYFRRHGLLAQSQANCEPSGRQGHRKRPSRRPKGKTHGGRRRRLELGLDGRGVCWLASVSRRESRDACVTAAKCCFNPPNNTTAPSRAVTARHKGPGGHSPGQCLKWTRHQS